MESSDAHGPPSLAQALVEAEMVMIMETTVGTTVVAAVVLAVTVITTAAADMY